MKRSGMFFSVMTVWLLAVMFAGNLFAAQGNDDLALKTKLEAAICKNIELKDVSLESAIEHIIRTTNVQFKYKVPSSSNDYPDIITVQLGNTSVYTFLEYLARATGCELGISDGTVIFTETGDSLFKGKNEFFSVDLKCKTPCSKPVMECKGKEAVQNKKLQGLPEPLVFITVRVLQIRDSSVYDNKTKRIIDEEQNITAGRIKELAHIESCTLSGLQGRKEVIFKENGLLKYVLENTSIIEKDFYTINHNILLNCIKGEEELNIQYSSQMKVYDGTTIYQLLTPIDKNVTESSGLCLSISTVLLNPDGAPVRENNK